MIHVRVLPTDELGAAAAAEVRLMVTAAFDGDFSDDDWQHAVGGVHVLVEDGPRLVAHSAVVARPLLVGEVPYDAGYVEAVATALDRRGEGLGSLAMTAAGKVIRDRFALGALSTGEHSFYERLGWERWLGPTWVRTAKGRRRTADEDDGVMVLRFGATAELHLTQSITCEERVGDDW